MLGARAFLQLALDGHRPARRRIAHCQLPLHGNHLLPDGGEPPKREILWFGIFAPLGCHGSLCFPLGACLVFKGLCGSPEEFTIEDVAIFGRTRYSWPVNSLRSIQVESKFKSDGEGGWLVVCQPGCALARWQTAFAPGVSAQAGARMDCHHPARRAWFAIEQESGLSKEGLS
jgi:hypothetical protein